MFMKSIGSKSVPFLAAMIVMAYGNLAAAPLWISGEDKRWPSDKYLTGIGAAESINAAQDKARAEIAKFFKVAIEQTTIERTSETSDMKDKISSVNMEQKTYAAVSDKIEGIEIAQVWYDKKEKLYWALAVLNKQRYGSIISNRIIEAEGKISSSLLAARSGGVLSNLERLKYLVAALEALNIRDELESRRRALGISVGGSGIEYAQRKEIETEIADIKQTTSFKILARSVGGDGAQDENSIKLKEILKERLIRFGFQVIENGSSYSGAILDDKASCPTVEARFAVSPFVRQGIDNAKDYWKYARWEGYFEVKDAGRVFVSAGASGSESNPDEKVSLKKAQISGLKVMGDLFDRKFRQEFGAVE